MARPRRTRARASRRPPPPQAPASVPSWIERGVLGLLIVATVALVVFVRLRLADTPLERDEGEYAYAGQLILQGVPPYEQAYNLKFPGTYYAYAVIMAVFGQTAAGIRMGLLLVNLATMGMVFGAGRRLAGPVAASVGACAFGLLTLDRWSMSVYGHATHFVALAATAGLWLLVGGIKDGRPWRLAGAGVLMGLAILMKQQALPFALVAVALAAWSGWRAGSSSAVREAVRRALLVGAGAAIMGLALVALLAAQGVLDRFWFWTFQYATAYVSATPASMAPAVFGMAWGYITQATAWVWYASIAGLGSLVIVRWKGDSRVVVGAWVLASMLSILPGYYFRPHYFIVMMPVAGILAGVLAAVIERGFARLFSATPGFVLAAAAVGGVGIASVSRDAHFLFRMTDQELVRAVYETNPFLESPEIGRYLNAHTTSEDRIAVLGSEPQIFFYANRRSATGYIYTYPLMERQPYAPRMQDEMRSEIERARPEYLVFVGVAASWGSRQGSDPRILNWANEYTQKCYERVGIVDIPPTGPSVVRWDQDAMGYQARSASQVLTFKRRRTLDCETAPSA